MTTAWLPRRHSVSAKVVRQEDVGRHGDRRRIQIDCPRERLGRQSWATWQAVGGGEHRRDTDNESEHECNSGRWPNDAPGAEYGPCDGRGKQNTSGLPAERQRALRSSSRGAWEPGFPQRFRSAQWWRAQKNEDGINGPHVVVKHQTRCQ